MEGNGIVDLTINSHELERTEGAWQFVASSGFTRISRHNASLWTAQSGGPNVFDISPSTQSVPLVFKYTRNTGQNQSLRFTNAASFFINKELTASCMLRLVWRVSFNADEQESGIYG